MREKNTRVKLQGTCEIHERAMVETRRLDRRINWSIFAKGCPFEETTALHVPVVYVDTPLAKAAYLDGSFASRLALAFHRRGAWRSPQPEFTTLIYDENDAFIGSVEFGGQFPRCRVVHWINAPERRLIHVIREGATDVMEISLGKGLSFI